MSRALFALSVSCFSGIRTRISSMELNTLDCGLEFSKRERKTDLGGNHRKSLCLDIVGTLKSRYSIVMHGLTSHVKWAVLLQIYYKAIAGYCPVSLSHPPAPTLRA